MAEGGKTFYEDTAGGRFKFVKVDDVVYYATKGDKQCYDIAGSPPLRTHGTKNWPWIVEGGENNASPKK